MKSEKNGPALPDFSLLLPTDIAEAAEAVLGEAVDGSLVPYPSYINRVYGLRGSSGKRVIAKFYRPGRWSEAAIREEHAFIAECAAEGVPVVAPLADEEGETLSAISLEDESGLERHFFFALFPFIEGRGWEPETDQDWLALGNLIGAMHRVGVRSRPTERPFVHPELSARPALRRLVGHEFIHVAIREEFETVCEETLDRISPRFDSVAMLRLHGDLHRGNLLRGGDGGFRIIDLDDMAVGPAVQDLWLFLPGRLDDSRREAALLREGYLESGAFDPDELNLIEPLRFMRMVSYLDWQARQSADAGFERAFPEWGTKAFWIKELEDLYDQIRVMDEG